MSVTYQTQADAARRLAGFMLFVIGVALMVGLYYVKVRAKSSSTLMRQLERQVIAEEAAIEVLQAEIAHLESPERLQVLAETHLGLDVSRVERVRNLDDLEAEFPLVIPHEPLP